MRTLKIPIGSCVLALTLGGWAAASAQTIYWTDVGSSKIQRASVDCPQGIEDLLTAGGVFTPIGIALDLVDRKMYWTEQSIADFMILRADLDGTNVEFLVTALASPSGIALDVEGSKMYWTDIGSGKIQRANLDGSEVEDLVTTGLILPRGIALDITDAKMYWTEGSPADFMILRANLDGTNVELLVTALASPSGIALDVQGSKMYWTDIGSGKIQRANLDGSEVEDLVTTGVILPTGIVLDITDAKMYWTEGSPADYMISRANLDGTNLQLLITGLSSPVGIALDPRPSVAGDIDGDCDVDLLDFGEFPVCVTGPGGGAPPPCDLFDFDFDNDVDLPDFGAFQLAYTGPL